MGQQGRDKNMQGALLALLEHEERLARWQSLPAATRQQVVEQLARMLLQTLAGEGGDEAGKSDSAGAP